MPSQKRLKRSSETAINILRSSKPWEVGQELLTSGHVAAYNTYSRIIRLLLRHGSSSSSSSEDTGFNLERLLSLTRILVELETKDTDLGLVEKTFELVVFLAARKLYDVAIEYAFLAIRYDSAGSFLELTQKLNLTLGDCFLGKALQHEGPPLETSIEFLKQALGHYEIALKQPQGPMSWLMTARKLGKTLELQGSYIEAKDLYEDAYSRFSDPEILLQLGVTYMTLEEPLKAKETLHSYIDLSKNPTSLPDQIKQLNVKFEVGRAALLVANAHLLLGDLQGAIDVLDKYLASSKDAEDAILLELRVLRASLRNNAGKILAQESPGLENSEIKGLTREDCKGRRVAVSDSAGVHIGISRASILYERFLCAINSSPNKVLEFLESTNGETRIISK